MYDYISVPASHPCWCSGKVTSLIISDLGLNTSFPPLPHFQTNPLNHFGSKKKKKNECQNKQTKNKSAI